MVPAWSELDGGCTDPYAVVIKVRPNAAAVPGSRPDTFMKQAMAAKHVSVVSLLGSCCSLILVVVVTLG